MTGSSMSPGMVLGGRYHLDVLLSEHDGARFWRATDVVLARSVAIHAVATTDPRAERILAASRESAKVSDPRLLRVLDCDETDELTWVINEWGQGTSLAVMLQQGPLAAERAAWATRELADVIALAHSRGVAHGRLLPESVLVSEAGTVRVLGLALDAALAGTSPANDPWVDDARQVASVLYAGLTGRWPGRFASSLPAAPREGEQPLRPRQVRAGIPRFLDALCDRALSPVPRHHGEPIRSALEISAALSDFLGEEIGLPFAPVAEPVSDPTEEQAAEVLLLTDSQTAEPFAAPLITSDQPVPEPVPVPLLEPEPAPAPVLEPEPEPERSVLQTPATDVGEPTQAHVFDEIDLDDFGPAPEPSEPPAPLVAEPPKPLFADEIDPTVAPRPVYDPAPFVPIPPVLETDTPSPRPPAGAAPGRRRWPLVLAALGLAASAAVGVWLLQDEDGEASPRVRPTPSATAAATPSDLPTAAPLRIFSVRDFDPEGDPPEENPGQVARAIDGDPSTGWPTQVYRGSARFGGLKSGVGLVLDLGSAQSIGSVELALAGRGGSAELWVTAPGVDDPPVDFSNLRRGATAEATGTSAVLRPSTAMQGRYVVVWLTRLPAVSGGFQAVVNEVAVRP